MPLYFKGRSLCESYYIILLGRLDIWWSFVNESAWWMRFYSHVTVVACFCSWRWFLSVVQYYLELGTQEILMFMFYPFFFYFTQEPLVREIHTFSLNLLPKVWHLFPMLLTFSLCKKVTCILHNYCVTNVLNSDLQNKCF